MRYGQVEETGWEGGTESKILFWICDIEWSIRHANGEVRKRSGLEGCFCKSVGDGTPEATALDEELGEPRARGRSGAAPQEHSLLEGKERTKTLWVIKTTSIPSPHSTFWTWRTESILSTSALKEQCQKIQRRARRPIRRVKAYHRILKEMVKAVQSGLKESKGVHCPVH